MAYQYDENGGPAGKRVEYYHNDHLGNIRLAFSDLDGDGAITVGDIYDPNNEITQERHYYPFGLTHNGPWFATVAPDNAYRYNGKELDEATGLYDYGARYYDPAVARWGQVDPLADQYAPISPYVYVANNPILLIDPDGRHIDIGYIDGQGETQYYRYGSGEEITNSFVQTVVNTLDKTVADGLDVEGVITTLANDNSATFINETTWDDHNNSSPAKGGGSVNWSPEGGIVTDNGDNRSPAVGLLHGLGHIFFETYNPEGLTGEPNYSDYPIGAEGDAAFNRDFNAYEQQQIEASGYYDKPSDKWVIQKVENPASSRLGQPTRNTHSYQRKYQAAGPFSTKEKNDK